MKTSVILVLLIFSAAHILALSCVDVLQRPEDAELPLDELKALPSKELVDCLAHLTKDKMPMESAEFIWQTLVRHFAGAYNIPENVMVTLHWATPAIHVEEYQNISMENVEVVQNFGLNYGLSGEKLASIAERVREDFGGKEPEDYTFYDLTALRQILCAFNSTEIEKIRPSVYREAAAVVGKLSQCPGHVMAAFAGLAVQSTAFGDPGLWTDATMEAVGAVADYLPKKATKMPLVG